MKKLFTRSVQKMKKCIFLEILKFYHFDFKSAKRLLVTLGIAMNSIDEHKRKLQTKIQSDRDELSLPAKVLKKCLFSTLMALAGGQKLI